MERRGKYARDIYRRIVMHQFSDKLSAVVCIGVLPSRRSLCTAADSGRGCRCSGFVGDITAGYAGYVIVFSSRSDKVDGVFMLHEQGAAIAAEAYARIREGYGVCLVTSGPGATNAITGLCGAYMDSIPVIFISGQAKIKQEMCILTVTTNAGILRTAAKIDTGNSLKEPFSQCPVIVMTRRSAEAITPDQLKEYETVTTLTYRENISGVRFVPFTAVGGRGILPCFLAKEVRINDRLCNEIVYIALCANDSLGEYKALVPSILC